MSSEDHPVLVVDKVSMEAERSPNRSQSGKDNQGKVPKKVHKAEREKMKREQLNELFLALANALEVAEQPNGKASVLTEATRFMKDMLAEIKSLGRENTNLLSESLYIASEKEELEDENSALKAAIAKLQNELKERIDESNIDLNADPPELAYVDECFRCPTSEPAYQQAQNVNPLYVVPICPDPIVSADPGTAQVAAEPAPKVSKPQARYPSPGDAWSSKLLEKHPK